MPSSILVATPSSFDLIRASLEGSIATVFPKSRGSGYDAAVNFASQASRYEEAEIGKTLFHFAVFGRTREQVALALSLVRNLRGTKGLQVVAGGKLTQDAFRAEAVLECFLEASGLSDPRAHCVQIVHESHLVERYLSGRTSASSIDVADVMRNAFQRDDEPHGKVYEFPCRYLLTRGFKFQPGHPSSEADQLRSAAVREGCDWCPFLSSALRGGEQQ
ncbi:MAG: hypothetical protein Q8M84_02995 [Thiobacillus sp.]|nr:hypothetical protein [Thiobacillus sp.]